MYFQKQSSGSMPAWLGKWMEQVVKHRIPRRLVAFDKRLPLVSLLLILTTSTSTIALFVMPPRSAPQTQSLTTQVADNSSLLECLQVAPPVLSPARGCQQTLIVHTFAFSYGEPFVGDYYPPDCVFNRVVFNLTVSSAGRQFDRLALMYFDDIEIFRTSTAEPTRTGIIWTYIKDMSAYLALFQQPQKIIFDLGNLIDDTYTGTWNTTLTVNFFTENDTLEPADIIMPISTGRSIENQSSAFIVPETRAVANLTLPQNAKKLIFSISACGQAAEEFWWSNVLSSETRVFGDETTLYGHSSFRELQLFIDGEMAGVAWPFPVIFTGGIVPGFWRPVVGIDAFDLREDEIDISPFLPSLSDNKAHSFEIRVVGIDDDGEGLGKLTESIESNWVVSGKLFIWLDPDTSVTTGTITTSHAPEPSLQLYSRTQKNVNGTVDALNYSIQVSRQISIDAIIYTSTGIKATSWKQNLTFSNVGGLSNRGNDQFMRHTTSGTFSSTSGYNKVFEYPLWVISSYNALSGGNLTINGEMGRGKNVQQTGDLAFPNDWKIFDVDRLPSKPMNTTFLKLRTNNWQNGTASYLSIPAQKRSYGSGSTEQIFTLSGTISQPIAVLQHSTNGAEAAGQPKEELYRRHIVAANDSVVYDDESYGGQKVGRNRFLFPSQWVHEEKMHEFAESGVRAMLGRGRY